MTAEGILIILKILESSLMFPKTMNAGSKEKWVNNISQEICPKWELLFEENVEIVALREITGYIICKFKMLYNNKNH